MRFQNFRGRSPMKRNPAGKSAAEIILNFFRIRLYPIQYCQVIFPADAVGIHESNISCWCGSNSWIHESNISCWCAGNSWNQHHFLLMQWESMKAFKATSFLLMRRDYMLMLGIVRRVIVRIFISFRYWHCWFVCSSGNWDAVAGKRGFCSLAGRPLRWKLRPAGFGCWTTRLTLIGSGRRLPAWGLQLLLPAVG